MENNPISSKKIRRSGLFYVIFFLIFYLAYYLNANQKIDLNLWLLALLVPMLLMAVFFAIFLANYLFEKKNRTAIFVPIASIIVSLGLILLINFGLMYYISCNAHNDLCGVFPVLLILFVMVPIFTLGFIYKATRLIVMYRKNKIKPN